MEWLRNHKDILFDIFLFIILFIISFVVSFMIAPIWRDQVWSYGFSYNISKGMIIYKDFNVLQTPLYFMIASLFIKIFGSYMISTCIFDSLLVACMGLMLFKMIGWKGIFPLLFFMVFGPSPYNLLCLVLLFLILYLIYKDKYHDFVVAFIVGLIFITKQNIGVLLFIPMFIYSKHKIQSIFVFLIPLFLLCIYLFCNGAFFSFIDYSFLGLFEFGGNKDIDVSIFLVELFCIIYLTYIFIKGRCKDKETLYVLIFQLILYPLCELRHFTPAFIVFLYYFLKNCKINPIKISVCLLECFYLGYAFFTNFIPADIQMKKDLLYLRNPSVLSDYLEDIYQKYDGRIEDVYFDSEYSYLLKLYYDIPISEFDFFLDGNLGYYAKQRIFKDLEKHCQEKKCIFMVYKKVDKDCQSNEYRSFIRNHYKKIGTYQNMFVYSS